MGQGCTVRCGFNRANCFEGCPAEAPVVAWGLTRSGLLASFCSCGRSLLVSVRDGLNPKIRTKQGLNGGLPGACFEWSVWTAVVSGSMIGLVGSTFFACEQSRRCRAPWPHQPCSSHAVLLFSFAYLFVCVQYCWICC